MGDLVKGKVAVVTGAGAGIGRTEVLGLADHGAKVIVNDLGTTVDGRGSSRGPADEVVAEIRGNGGEAVASYASVATVEGAESIIRLAFETYGRLDILINNAGITKDRMIYNVSDEEWISILQINLFGTFYTTRAACRIMRKQKYGRIINTSSHAGLGNMGQAAYSAAKEGIVGLSRTVGRDMARYGVTCNVIRPVSGTRGFRDMLQKGGLRQAWTSMWGVEKAEKRIHQMLELNKPEDIASLVIYLASEKADNINSCIFEVWHGHIGIYKEPVTATEILWKNGRWTPEELAEAIPQTLTKENVRELPPFFPF